MAVKSTVQVGRIHENSRPVSAPSHPGVSYRQHDLATREIGRLLMRRSWGMETTRCRCRRHRNRHQIHQSRHHPRIATAGLEDSSVTAWLGVHPQTRWMTLAAGENQERSVWGVVHGRRAAQNPRTDAVSLVCQKCGRHHSTATTSAACDVLRGDLR